MLTDYTAKNDKFIRSDKIQNDIGINILIVTSLKLMQSYIYIYIQQSCRDIVELVIKIK